MNAAHPFDADTAVEAIGEHEYAARLTDRWTALTGTPNGGYLLATALRALAREMPYPDPLVVSAYFLRAGQPGPARIRTELARSGRRVATGEARLVQDGVERVRIVASFTDLSKAEGRTLIVNEPPSLPAPQDCVDPLADASLSGFSIVDRVAFRLADKPGWLQGAPSGDPGAELWMRFAEPREPDLFALSALVDASAPVVMDLPGVSASATLELTVHLRARPAPGWLACRARTRHVIDGYHEEDFEMWDSGGRLVAQARQMAQLR